MAEQDKKEEENGVFDAQAFKAKQREGWAKASHGFFEHRTKMEEGAQEVSNALVEWAQIREGSHVLDIAAGVGEPTITLAKRVGSAGHVISTDQSPDMLHFAKRVAEEEGVVDRISFEVIDAETLDYPSASFDAVVSRWGLFLLPNLDEFLVTARRILRPGGRLAAALWSKRDSVPVISVTYDALERNGMAIRPSSEKERQLGPFALSDAEALKARFEAAGFVNVHTDILPITFCFSSFDEYRAYRVAISPSLGNLGDRFPQEQVDGFWQDVEADVHKRFSMWCGGQPLAFPCDCLMVVGRRLEEE